MPAPKRKTDPGPGLKSSTTTTNKRQPRKSAPAAPKPPKKTATSKKRKAVASDEEEEEEPVKPKRGRKKAKVGESDEEVSEPEDGDRDADDDGGDGDDEEIDEDEADEDVRSAGMRNQASVPASSNPPSSPHVSEFLGPALKRVQNKRSKPANEEKFEKERLEVQSKFDEAEEEFAEIMKTKDKGTRSKKLEDEFKAFIQEVDDELDNHGQYVRSRFEQDTVAFTQLRDGEYTPFLNAHFSLTGSLEGIRETYEQRPIDVHDLMQKFEKKLKSRFERVLEKDQYDASNLIKATRKLIRNARRQDDAADTRQT